MNKIRLFIALVLTVVTLTHSKPSQATVGAFVSAPVLIAGIVIAGGGTIVTAVNASKCDGDLSGLCAGLIWLLGIPVIAVGLIVLDGEQGVAFTDLSSADAGTLGISAAELEIYNSEVDQANALLADVKAELSKLEKPTAQDSAAVWAQVKDLVSPETYATMQKIVTHK